MTEFDDEKAYSDANLFKQARATLIDALKQNKLKKASDGSWEAAEVGTEYISPNQCGGIYGTVYRQYFTTVLTSTNPRLDTGGNVVKLIDWTIYTSYSGDYFITHGQFRGFATGEVNIKHGITSKNISVSVVDQTLINGWVDYTK